MLSASLSSFAWSIPAQACGISHPLLAVPQDRVLLVSGQPAAALIRWHARPDLLLEEAPALDGELRREALALLPRAPVGRVRRPRAPFGRALLLRAAPSGARIRRSQPDPAGRVADEVRGVDLHVPKQPGRAQPEDHVVATGAAPTGVLPAL